MEGVKPLSNPASPDELPRVVQGSPAPCFRGAIETATTLMCSSGCGQLLIDQYDPDSFASVGIECFRCCAITWTPAISPGEVLAASTVSLGETGRYFFRSTVIVPPGAVVACDQEIRREIELTSPKDRSIPLDISAAGLKELAECYDRIVGGKFALQRKRVERVGASCIQELPFAWAVVHLERCLASGVIDLHRRETITAVTWLQIFVHVVGSWEHHPRFQTIARDLGKPKSFLHTSSQLIAAAYLFRTGNRVGLSLEEKHGEPNPDLYIRGVMGTRVFLEVKTPQALQSNDDGFVGRDRIHDTVKRCIKDSMCQINRNHRGVLIISSSYMAPHFPSLLEDCIRGVLESRGRSHRSLAAVVGMSQNINFTPLRKRINLNLRFQFSVTLNRYYDGQNPITTQRPGSVENLF